MNIKAIIFDLDDTLLNSKDAEYNAICEFKSKFKEFDSITNDKFAVLWGNLVSELYEKYLNGEITFEEQRIERIKRIFEKINKKIENEEAKEKFNIYMSLYKKRWAPFDNAFQTLEKLKNKYILAIISNGDSLQQREKIKKIGIEKYFEQIIISSEIGIAKPEKKIFQHTCQKLKLQPQECIMVGDKFEVDIKGAINAGMKAVWINRKNKDINYDYTIKELCELEKTIEKF